MVTPFSQNTAAEYGAQASQARWAYAGNPSRTIVVLGRRACQDEGALAGVTVPKQLFRAILERIRRLRPPETVPG